MNKIKELRKEKRISQKDLADSINVHQTAISQWEQGRTNPDFEALNRLADYFNVSVDYLLGRDFPKGAIPVKSSTDDIEIPILGSVVAGPPNFSEENIIGYVSMEKDAANGGEYFALKIDGDSMEPRLYENDIVIVRSQSDVENGEVAIVRVNGHDATIKKVKKQKSGMALIPYNHDYETIFYTNEEIEQLPVTIMGKIVESRSKW